MRSLGARDVVDRLQPGLHADRPDVRRDLRCRRQALVPALSARAGAGRGLRLDRPRLHLPPAAARLVTRFVGSRRAALGIGRYRKEDLLLVKRLVEAGEYRPVIDRTLSPRRGRRGDPLRRERPEDRQRRAAGRRRGARRSARAGARGGRAGRRRRPGALRAASPRGTPPAPRARSPRRPRRGSTCPSERSPRTSRPPRWRHRPPRSRPPGCPP